MGSARWHAVLATGLLATVGLFRWGFGCSASAEEPDAGPGTDANVDSGATTDPFCKGRPLLHFCEDFDERPLPGAFSETKADPSIAVTIGDDSLAPSPPKIVLFQKSDATPASSFLFTPRAPRGPKGNTFFRVKVEAFGTEAEIAAFDEDGGRRLALVVGADGAIALQETPVPTATDGGTDGGEAGVSTNGRYTSTVKLEPNVWASVRWDIRLVDGVARSRLRIGSATAFDAQTWGLTGLDAATRLSVGVAAAGPIKVAFDSVTFEPDLE